MTLQDKNTPLLEVKHLYKSYPASRQGLFKRKRVTVLHDVSLSVAAGEIVGLVGESGSGKSTIGRALLNLVQADSGSVRFDGEELVNADKRTIRRRRKDMQVIFQDPYASLDPRKTVRATLAEALDTHGLHQGKAREQRLRQLMQLVGLNIDFLERKPHQFSGGQRQRIGIARALSVEPRFIVADEAVSALDVSIQAQILNLIADLREKTGISLLFISHDLSVVRFISDRVVVLYLGRVMEMGPADDVYFSPAHPYSQTLVSAEPGLDRFKKRIVLTGEMPSPLAPPSGCVFHSRCPVAMKQCAQIVPQLREFAPGRWQACIKNNLNHSSSKMV